jgi:2-succinyl-5-enolpyruvyl-6-hydroxy-3-cyclohexene-1-carboxylate synthase
VICPGSRSTPLALALWRQAGIEARVIVDERSAAFFALGAAQATRTPAAVVCTSGTAAANLHPAVCEADEAGVPLIVLTADRPPELRDVGAGQTIDQLNLYGSAARWFCEVGTHDADDAGLLHMRSVTCRAYALAAGDPRPGPVHLNLAFRDPLGPEPHPEDVTARSPLALGGREDRPLTSVPSPPSPPATPLVDALAERIAAAPRGVIVAGRMNQPGAPEAIAALARAAGYPILADPVSQLRFGPHDRELVVSAYEPIARAKPRELEPQLVLRFGDLPTCKPLRAWLAELQDAAHLVVDPAGGWNEPLRIAGTMIRADPAQLATALAQAAPRTPDDDWVRAWKRAAGAAADAIAAELESLDEPTEPAAHAALSGLYRDGDLVYTASSMPIRDQEAFARGTGADVLFLANRGANGIDGLISSALGASAASGRPTWVITGDLGLFHDMNALASLRHADAPVRIVVLNNNGGGIFEFLPQADQIEHDEFEALLGTPLGLEPVRVANLHSIEHRLVRSLGDLEAATADTALVELPVDRRANVELHRRLNERAGRAVADALAANE